MKKRELNKLRGKNIWGISLVLSFCIQIFFPVTAFGAVQDLRYQAELVPIDMDIPLGAYGLLELPDEVLDQGRPGNPDLRLYAQDQEVPYAILPSAVSGKDPRILSVDMFNTGQDDKGNLVFEVRVPNEQWVKELQLLTPDTNFIRKVKVEGSREEKNWVVIQPENTIFDLSQENKSRNTMVYFAKANFPFLRITVSGEGEPLLQIDGVKLSLLGPQESMGELKERPYDRSTKTLEGGVQEIIFDLYHQNLPNQELTFVVEDANFSRQVELYESETKENWRLVTKGELYSYQLDKASADQRNLKFSTTRRYLKLLINNQDNRPLTIQEIKIRGLNPIIVFPVEKSQGYNLYWGSEQLSKPNYDLQKMVTNLNYGKLSRFKVQKLQDNPEFIYTDNRPWTEQNRWLLNSMLILVVLVLAVIIARSFGKISR